MSRPVRHEPFVQPGPADADLLPGLEPAPAGCRVVPQHTVRRDSDDVRRTVMDGLEVDGRVTGGLAAVEVHVLSDANALPAASFTPLVPPLIVAV